MTTQTISDHSQSSNDFWNHHLQLNPGVLADQFRQILMKYPKDNNPGGELTPNWCRQNIISHLVGSSFWRKNNISKMLEWAVDKKNVNAAQIAYYEKYVGEFYSDEVAHLEKAENEFIDTEIIPLLKKELEA